MIYNKILTVIICTMSLAACNALPPEKLTASPSTSVATAPLVTSGTALNQTTMPQAVIMRPIIPIMHPTPYYPPQTDQNGLLLDADSKTTTYGQVTLIGLNLNNAGDHIIVNPGAFIPAVAAYTYNCPDCKADSLNQIIIGIDGIGAQRCIYNGGIFGQGIAYFQLAAPRVPGTYHVRFRYAQGWDCADALKNWWNVNHAPSQAANIGTITVQ